MKKIILGAIAVFSLANVKAQYEIRLDGNGSDIAGTTIDIDVYPEVAKDVHLWVLNTGSNEDIYITRVRQNVPISWLQAEKLCWPPICETWTTKPDNYTTPRNSAPTISSSQITPDSLVSEATSGVFTEIAELKPGITAASGATGTATFMYYLTNSSGTHVDSVGINFTIAQDAAINEVQKLDVSVSPNPASNYLNVDFDGANSAQLKMVDVLGNVVLKKSVAGKETINVSDFRNGIYFVTLEAESRKPVVRKVIVRH